MKVILLNASKYANPENNNGDAIIIDTKEKMCVYDCGCEEHANRIIEYANQKGYGQFDVILSHNDSDHFDGIPTLIESGMVNCVVTNLLYKHVDDILKKIDDGRRNHNSTIENIKKAYENISSLSGKCTLVDYIDYLPQNNLEIIGPEYEYMIEAVAKEIDSTQGDTIDGDTTKNATSIQFSVIGQNNKILLTGDATFEAIKENLHNHNIIQLPHHGKADPAEKIFDFNSSREDRNTIQYLVSDNTGNSNGGSDSLNVKGHIVKNTKDIKTDIEIDLEKSPIISKGTFGGLFDGFNIR